MGNNYTEITKYVAIDIIFDVFERTEFIQYVLSLEMWKLIVEVKAINFSEQKHFKMSELTHLLKKFG